MDSVDRVRRLAHPWPLYPHSVSTGLSFNIWREILGWTGADWYLFNDYYKLSQHINVIVYIARSDKLLKG